jgi:hypothetical protein
MSVELTTTREEVSMEVLLKDCLDFIVQGQADVRNYFTEQAFRSRTNGYNTAWAKIAEGCAKVYDLERQDSRIMTDQFIFTLAIMLSEYFGQQIMQ